ncbi:hypothetical protein CWE04_01675 [Thomasclavelia cocleata]|nr:SHOCT domain-containing protein [Thomasclavelia cocleata]PJN81594.1 hypothetical protein CWE04_01675 [Thomasclavelia cocleata]
MKESDTNMYKIKLGAFSELEVREKTIYIRKGERHEFPFEELESVAFWEYRNSKKGWLFFKFINKKEYLSSLFMPKHNEICHDIYKFLLPYTHRLIVNDDDKILTVYPKSKNNSNSININFSNINSFELIQNETKIISGSYIEALAGKAILGDTGAIIGAMGAPRLETTTIRDLRIKLNLNSFEQPHIYISYIQKNDEKKDELTEMMVEQCQKDLSILENICCMNSKNNTAPDDNSIPLEELKKLHELLQIGIITQEEFDTKKKQLLGL